MQVVPLPLETAVRKRADFFIDVQWTDFAAAAAGAVALVPFIAAALTDMLEVSHVELITPFANSADNAFNSSALTVGDPASANRYLTSTELNLNGAYVPIAPGTGTRYTYAAATNFQLTFTPTAGKNLANLTQGEVRVYLRRVNPDVTP